jgi:hypothetical protein
MRVYRGIPFLHGIIRLSHSQWIEYNASTYHRE